MKILKRYWFEICAGLLTVLLLAGTGYSLSTICTPQQIVNQEKRTKIFMECLEKMQAIAPKSDHTELESAIDSCDSAASSQSLEPNPECVKQGE